MKKLKIIMKIVFFVATILLISEVCIYAATGKANVSSLRIRKNATTDSAILEVLSAGDSVEILREEGSWYKVKAKGVTGYVSKQFINTGDNSQVVVEEPKKEETQITSEEKPTIPEENKENNQKEEQVVDEQKDDNVIVEDKKEEEKNIEEEPQKEENKQIVNKIYKTSENASVSILPLITADTIGEIKKNEEVNVINNAGLWVYVKTSNIAGWIKIDKLLNEDVVQSAENNINQTTQENVTNNNANNNVNTNNNTSNYAKKTMYIKGTVVNVRLKANTSSNVVCAAYLNEEVTVIGEENNWYKIEFKGKTGYIRNDLVSNKKTETTSRSNDIQRTTVVTSVPQNISQETAQNVPVSASGVTGNDIVAYAKQFVGCSYVYGAAGPNSFDCSGLTMYVYSHFGYSLSHSSKVQATQGRAVTGSLQPGDILVFTNNGSTVGHVGIYIGNDKFVHASDSTTGVIISNLSDSWNKSKYMGARRIL